jgi:hypothetical protein
VSIDNKEKRKAMNKVLNQFRELGTVFNLTFSGQEILKDCILGFDGVHQKLLVQKNQDENTFHSIVIDLNEVKECTVKKHYGKINSGDLKKRKLEHFLEKIVLQFAFVNNHPPVEVRFYHHSTNHIFDIPVLEQKARHWQAILSIMPIPEKQKA